MWAETSPAVASVRDVESFLVWWLEEEKRREGDRERLQQWREEKQKQAKEVIDAEEEEGEAGIKRRGKPDEKEEEEEESRRRRRSEAKVKIKEWRELRELESRLSGAKAVMQEVAAAILDNERKKDDCRLRGHQHPEIR